MKTLIATFLIIIHFSINPIATLANTKSDELPTCVVITHCVREDWHVNDVEESFAKALEAISNTPRTKIIEKSDSFIHAEAKTKWRRYTDDLLVKAIPNKSIIQVRSESRVGIGDNGVNQKRINELAYRLTTNQLK